MENVLRRVVSNLGAYESGWDSSCRVLIGIFGASCGIHALPCAGFARNINGTVTFMGLRWPLTTMHRTFQEGLQAK